VRGDPGGAGQGMARLRHEQGVRFVVPVEQLGRTGGERGAVASDHAAFATGSAELLDRHYEPDALLVPKPGHPLTGAARVAAHRHLLGFGAPIEATARHVYVAGDVALLIVDWAIQPVGLHGTAADVVRRCTDGEWRYVIDNPYGTA